MGITLPADLAGIAGQVGVQWPQADETKMHNAAQAWRTAAAKLTTLAKDADKAASDALGAMSGQAADAADQYWGKFVQGENAKFTQAVQGCLAAADRLEQAAQKIGAAKVEIVRKLTAVSQQAGAAGATPGDLSKAGLPTLLSGAGADINGILGDLTGAVNPSTLATPTVTADTPADLSYQATGKNGGLLGLSSGLPTVDGLMSTPGVDPTRFQVDPATGQYVDKTTGQVIDPKTGLPVLPVMGADAPTGQFPVGGPHPAGAPPVVPLDNSAAPTGPVPRHVVDAATPPDYGGGYSGGGGGGYTPSPVYSDPTPTGPVHVAPHVPQSTTVQSAAPVYSPPPAPEAPAYQAPSGGGGNTYWTPPADAPVAAGPGGVAGPRMPVGPVYGAPGAPGISAPGGPVAGAPVAGGPVAGGPAAGGPVAGGVAGGPVAGGGAVGGPMAGGAGSVGAGQPGVGAGQGAVGQAYAQQPPGGAQGAGAGAIVNSTTRRPSPGDLSGVYVDPSVAPVKPVVKKTVSPGLFLVYMFPIGHMPTPSSRPARQLPPPPAEVDYAAGLRFPPHDHPDSGLIQALGSTPAEAPEPRGGEDSGLADGYDPLGGENERDWDRRFLVRAGTEERRAEYAWPPGELFPEGGCDAGEAVVLEPGAVIDRFGTPEGRVFSAENTPFTQRSLPPEHLEAGYRRYRVLAPLPMWQTISAAWFAQAGGGVRYRSVYPAADLVALGFLEAVA
ncbi:glycohydrolase toxin TNT-related protein [Kutzneria buriramensis]|uniref:Uncharacterized protein DUF4237 n=1 Tax=Kutzneria buriramensis TaxID=1045776 RepID=A0A3E0IAY6_9PSEU|nr:glycohydrolase toxin TNT-related protein [Kutzneria buriramensis]REH55761.1 uncharacterized protein DUF4237 [Kutzneria buriramensis]